MSVGDTQISACDTGPTQMCTHCWNIILFGERNDQWAISLVEESGDTEIEKEEGEAFACDSLRK